MQPVQRYSASYASSCYPEDPFLIAGQARRRGSYRAGYLSRRIPLLAKKTYSARTVQALLYVNMMLQRLWEAYVRTTKNGR